MEQPQTIPEQLKVQEQHFAILVRMGLEGKGVNTNVEMVDNPPCEKLHCKRAKLSTLFAGKI